MNLSASTWPNSIKLHINIHENPGLMLRLKPYRKRWRQTRLGCQVFPPTLTLKFYPLRGGDTLNYRRNLKVVVLGQFYTTLLKTVKPKSHPTSSFSLLLISAWKEFGTRGWEGVCILWVRKQPPCKFCGFKSNGEELGQTAIGQVVPGCISAGKRGCTMTITRKLKRVCRPHWFAFQRPNPSCLPFNNNNAGQQVPQLREMLSENKLPKKLETATQ